MRWRRQVVLGWDLTHLFFTVAVSLVDLDHLRLIRFLRSWRRR
jgi:hypothetical protein